MSFEVAGRKLESLVLKTLVRTVKVGKMKKLKLAFQSYILSNLRALCEFAVTVSRYESCKTSILLRCTLPVSRRSGCDVYSYVCAIRVETRQSLAPGRYSIMKGKFK